jgi:uncharacterized protein (TIGR02118 family)
MIKRLSLARRLPGLTSDDFKSHWLGPHAEIARSIPRLRGYVVNIIPEPGDIGWDGIAETWFDTVEDATAAFTSGPTASLLIADRPKFIETVKIVMADEHVVLAPPGRQK